LFFVIASTFFAPPSQAGLFSVSPEKEKSIGADASREIESQAPLITGPVEAWVESVGKRLAAATKPDFEYSFRVINSPDINAFALPGGYVYVNSGLRKIAQTDDELAAVMAHEITHAEEHHFARQYSRASKRGAILGIGAAVLGIPNIAANAIDIVNFAVTQKYSRELESEADTEGMKRMARAGYDPAAMVTILERLAKESDRFGTLDKWFASHPEGDKRIAAAKQELQEIKTLQGKHDPSVMPVAPSKSTSPDKQ
jgi:predicted Zn-dependent protease